MASYIRQKPPRWFGVATKALFLWSVLGCIAFYLYINFDSGRVSDMHGWGAAYYSALPGWFTYDYAIAVGAALAGTIALLRRSRAANLLFPISLAAIVVQFGYLFLFTDLIAHKGMVATVPLPLLIVALAIFQIRLSGLATRRGWII